MTRRGTHPRAQGGTGVTNIEKSIEVEVPVAVAYNQGTQFEEFPQFMEGVEEVRQLDDKRLHWKASILGVTREWDAEIRSRTSRSRGARSAGRRTTAW